MDKVSSRLNPQPRKAFIFDMDGVIINSEELWIPFDRKFLIGLLGEDICNQIGSTVGLGVDGFYGLSIKYGKKIEREELYKNYDEEALNIYATAAIKTFILF